jgi:beta-glucosidase/6-phospho-beta-glucosidase/beta-galactosidase
MSAPKFPEGFFWGTATSSYQIEARGTRMARAPRSGTRTRTRPAGFGDRFGLIYVDFKTERRTPKLSATWFREAATRNAVV